MTIKPASYYKGRICCICRYDLSIGNNHGFKEYNDKGDWTGRWICKPCYRCADWRSGNLDPSSSHGKGFVGQQIIAKTYGIEDCNLKMNNFRFCVDLSKITGYGYGEVKTVSLNRMGEWKFSRVGGNKFDVLFLLCMDCNWPWKDVVRVYVIPWEAIGDISYITIYENPSKESRWEEFRTDERSFNSTYHNMKLENCKVLRKKK